MGVKWKMIFDLVFVPVFLLFSAVFGFFFFFGLIFDFLFFFWVKKLTALKRAYADVILNTAKEAAARILSSERKALRFQRELFSTKEDALQMLLRLKQMMDSKVQCISLKWDIYNFIPF